MAGRERHFVEVSGIPRAHDDPAVLGAVLDGVDHVGQLRKSGRILFLAIMPYVFPPAKQHRAGRQGKIQIKVNKSLCDYVLKCQT